MVPMFQREKKREKKNGGEEEEDSTLQVSNSFQAGGPELNLRTWSHKSMKGRGSVGQNGGRKYSNKGDQGKKTIFLGVEFVSGFGSPKRKLR